MLLICFGQLLLAQESPLCFQKQSDSIRINLEKHVQYLSSHKLLGRSSLTGHDIKASNYIDSIFQSFDLNPYLAIPERTFFQPFAILSTIPQRRTMNFMGSTYDYGNDFICLGTDPKISKKFEIVFGGFGEVDEIDSPDLNGKALLIFANNLRIAGMRVSEYAMEKGCSLIIVANPNYPKQFESISQHLQEQHNSRRFSIIQSKPSSPSRFFSKLNNPIPQVLISDRLAARMLGENPMKLAKSLEKGKPLKSIPSELKVCFNLSYNVDTIFTRNVISYIPSSIGSQESILVCAHIDHLAPEGRNWFPGADDNASGISIIIELARLFTNDMKNGYLPHRNIVFAAFTAEEIGLFGSEFYSLNPLFNIDSITAVLNFDMIGKMGKQLKHGNNLFVSGKNRLDGFVKIINAFNSDSTMTVDTKDLEKITLFTLSDHYHFMEKGIPSFLLTTGLHDDYHKPTDTSEKLSYDKMVKIIQLAYDAIKHFADKPSPWE